MRLTSAAAAIALIAWPAPAQPGCAPRAVVIAKLGQGYGETRRGLGLVSSGAIFELWASALTGSWTILRTTPDGLTCVMAVGDGWQDDPPALPGSPT